jgi:hypothetical protein
MRKAFFKVLRWSFFTLAFAGLTAGYSREAQASCTSRFVAMMEDCAQISNWLDRSACGLVAMAEYVECLAVAMRTGQTP